MLLMLLMLLMLCAARQVCGATRGHQRKLEADAARGAKTDGRDFGMFDDVSVGARWPLAAPFSQQSAPPHPHLVCARCARPVYVAIIDYHQW